jgi:hypothetical protein
VINLHHLASKLTENGIMDKAFYDMNRDEVEAMVQAVVDSLEPTPMVMPYISMLYGEPVLVIPSNAPEELKPWKRQGENEGYHLLFRILQQLSANDDMMRRYLGENWKENTNV